MPLDGTLTYIVCCYTGNRAKKLAFRWGLGVAPFAVPKFGAEIISSYTLGLMGLDGLYEHYFLLCLNSALGFFAFLKRKR